jgi:hypothetical protein
MIVLWDRLNDGFSVVHGCDMELFYANQNHHTIAGIVEATRVAGDVRRL